MAATVVADASLRVRVDAVGEDTTLAGIQRMVEQAQESRSKTQRLADRTAALLFYIAVVAAAITAAVWVAAGQPDFALNRSVTVLVIACPHALGSAIPLVTAISTPRSARSGILVKDRLALEAMRNIDTVLFDKTGTLTLGEHQVTDTATTALGSTRCCDRPERSRLTPNTPSPAPSMPMPRTTPASCPSPAWSPR